MEAAVLAVARRVAVAAAAVLDSEEPSLISQSNWENSYLQVAYLGVQLKEQTVAEDGKLPTALIAEMMLITDLAEAAGVSDSNIRKLLLKGTIKGRKHGGTWVIPAEEARRYLNSREGRTRAFFGRKRKQK